MRADRITTGKVAMSAVGGIVEAVTKARRIATGKVAATKAGRIVKAVTGKVVVVWYRYV